MEIHIKPSARAHPLYIQNKNSKLKIYIFKQIVCICCIAVCMFNIYNIQDTVRIEFSIEHNKKNVYFTLKIFLSR